MEEKEKRIIHQELWALVAQTFESDKHALEIQERMMKIVLKEDDPDDIHTPNKRKVIEEIQLQWRFVQTIYEDVKEIAGKLNRSDLIPGVPELEFRDDLWDCEKTGSSDKLYAVNDAISAFQQKLFDLCYKLMDDVA